MMPDRTTPALVQRLLVIAFSGALAACSSSGHLEHPPENLMALMNVGISGSRIHLYEITPDGSFIKITQLFTRKDVA